MNSLAKILIVDDNPKYLEDVLPMYGYEVEVATDGIKALQLIQQAKPQPQASPYCRALVQSTDS